MAPEKSKRCATAAHSRGSPKPLHKPQFGEHMHVDRTISASLHMHGDNGSHLTITGKRRLSEVNAVS